MKKKTLVAELYCRDEQNEESIYAVYEVRNDEKEFLGGLHLFDAHVLDMCDSEDEFEDVAKGIVLDYAEDGGELMTKDEIEDWEIGTTCMYVL